MPSTLNPRDSYDYVFGRVYGLPGGMLLSIGIAPEQLLSMLPVMSGGLCIRYGMRLISQPNEIIVPDLFIGETGQRLTGREAWHYIRRYYGQHPLEKVVGWDANGRQQRLSLKEISFDSPVRVLVYSQVGARTPSAKIDGLLVGERASEIPDLVSQYLPVVNNFEHFLKPQLMISASST